MTSWSALTLLGLGLIFGLKHAGDVDHVVAVSTIVSQQRNLLRAAAVGALWGLGHAFTLLVVGGIVLGFRLGISTTIAGWLELTVALMIIVLGILALKRVFQGRKDVHIHRHQHDGISHVHIHFHDPGKEHSRSSMHSHGISRLGVKPLLIGAVHGLAGSAALTLIVLTQTSSLVLGLLYLLCFGAGATIGMLLLSGLIGLPFALTERRLTGLHNSLQMVAGALSIAFGIWYAYHAL